MAIADRTHWDTIYLRRAADEYPVPDPLLFQFTPPARPHATALDVACGVGQNGLWLAEQGYTVNLLDISRPALLRAQDEATERALRNVNFFQVDLDETTLERDSYDLVCVVRFLQRDLMRQIRAAIKPGGRILYETFNTRWLETNPNANRNYVLNPGELTGYFGDWRILHNREIGSTSQIVAIKPDRPS